MCFKSKTIHGVFSFKRAVIWSSTFFIFFFSNTLVWSQKSDSIPYHGEVLNPIVVDSTATFGITLDEVMIFQPLRFETRGALKKYLILRYRTLKVYPYAKLAADRLDTLTKRLERIPNKREKKAYTKRIEKFVYDEFEEELKKLSRSQGRILIKLVHRQTGATTHDLIKRIRNGWRAFIYQTTASLFKLTLKDTYGPERNYEDFLIEDILQRAASDGTIALDPTALNYNLDSLYTVWKASKGRYQYK